MTSVTTLPVFNEEDAWSLLQAALAGKLPDDTFEIDMGDWAEIYFHFKGPALNSTLTTSMMEAFIELQNNIYRVYAKLHHDSGSARTLTLDEKRALDIFVQVSPGSTQTKAILKDAVKKLVQGAVNKMQARHYVIIAMSGILALTSQSMWKDYLSVQSEAKKADLHVALSKEESHKLEIFSDAMKQVPHVASIKNDADEFRNRVLKSGKSADHIVVAGQEISKDQAKLLVRSTRTTSEEVQLNGNYRILKVDSSKIDFFRVELLGEDGKAFWADLQDITIAKERNKELIQAAEWNKKPIYLLVNGTAVRGEITTAKIIDVKERFSPSKP